MSGIEAIAYAFSQYGGYIAAAAATASAVGTYQAGKAQAATNKANAAAQEYNAEIQAQNADVARRNAASREDLQRREGNAKNAHLRAAVAESGFDPASGTLGLVQEQSADSSELDALMIRYAGNLEGRGYSAQSVLERYGGSVSRMNAAASNRAAYIGAASSLLSSASNYSRGGLLQGGK